MVRNMVEPFDEWSVDGPGSYSWRFVAAPDKPDPIAITILRPYAFYADESKELEANARLIAAAPDLLKAVKVARDGFRAAKVEILAAAMEEVIAKAERHD